MRMRLDIKILFLCILLFFMGGVYAESVSIKAGETHLLSSRTSDGKFLHFIVNNKDLARVPDWNGKGKAPLSKKNAKELVNSKYRKIARSEEFKITRISLESQYTNCKSGQGCPELLWYYLVKIKGVKPEVCVVLINGDVVEPKDRQ